MPTIISVSDFGCLTRRNGMLPKDETIYKNRKQVKPK